MNGSVEIALIITAVGYTLVRRMMGEPAQAKRMLVLPAVLVVIGFKDLSPVAQTDMSTLFLIATTTLGLVFGVLRGISIRLYAQDHVVFMRYTWVTVALWVASVATKVAAGFLLALVEPHGAAAPSSTLLLTLGAGLVAEGVVVLVKALRTDGRIIWAKGKDGRPHRPSPFLDRLQDRIHDPRS